MYIDSSTNYNITIGSNADALKIKEILSNSSNKVSQSIQRMSSGLKINSAKDDAAGIAISDRMLIELRGNLICQSNVQSANALLTTAVDTLDGVLENVSRIRDLTLQAKNGTYSNQEIKAMQDEVEQLIAEIDRLSENSKYSKLDLFGGDLAKNGIAFQVGANIGEDNEIAIDSALGIFNSLKFDDIMKYTLKEVSNKFVNVLGVEEEIAGLISGEAVFSESDDAKIYYLATGDNKEGYYKINKNGENYEAEELKIYQFKGEVSSENDLINVVNAKVGDVYTINNKAYEYKWESNEDNGAFVWSELNSSIADKIVPEENKINPYNEEIEDKKFNIIKINSDSKAYEIAINALDGAIDDISNRKSTIGSIQNRLSSALDTLTIQYSNISNAKSIITDTDIATEASSYTQSQIIQQVSTALLSQANQTPAIALSLI